MGSESSLSLSEKTRLLRCSLPGGGEGWPFTRGVDEAISDGGGSTMLETEPRVSRVRQRGLEEVRRVDCRIDQGCAIQKTWQYKEKVRPRWSVQ